MLDILEFITLLLKVLTWALIVVFVLIVLPAMTQLAREEFAKPKPEPYRGQHWRDPQDYDKKMYIIAFVNRHREDHGGIQRHRRLSHVG